MHPNYRAGKDKDNRCAAELREAGYWAQAAHASKGIFDVVAVRKDGKGVVWTRFIQVKSFKRKLVSIEAVGHQYLDDLKAMVLIPSDRWYVTVELWLWTAKQKMKGQKGYQPAGWRKFLVFPAPDDGQPMMQEILDAKEN